MSLLSRLADLHFPTLPGHLHNPFKHHGPAIKHDGLHRWASGTRSADRPSAKSLARAIEAAMNDHAAVLDLSKQDARMLEALPGHVAAELRKVLKDHVQHLKLPEGCHVSTLRPWAQELNIAELTAHDIAFGGKGAKLRDDELPKSLSIIHGHPLPVESFEESTRLYDTREAVVAAHQDTLAGAATNRPSVMPQPRELPPAERYIELSEAASRLNNRLTKDVAKTFESLLKDTPLELLSPQGRAASRLVSTWLREFSGSLSNFQIQHAATQLSPLRKYQLQLALQACETAATAKGADGAPRRITADEQKTLMDLRQRESQAGNTAERDRMQALIDQHLAARSSPPPSRSSPPTGSPQAVASSFEGAFFDLDIELPSGPGDSSRASSPVYDNVQRRLPPTSDGYERPDSFLRPGLSTRQIVGGLPPRTRQAVLLADGSGGKPRLPDADALSQSRRQISLLMASMRPTSEHGIGYVDQTLTRNLTKILAAVDPEWLPDASRPALKTSLKWLSASRHSQNNPMTSGDGRALVDTLTELQRLVAQANPLESPTLPARRSVRSGGGR